MNKVLSVVVLFLFLFLFLSGCSTGQPPSTKRGGALEWFVWME